MWGAPEEQHHFVAYANAQRLLPRGARERWSININGSRPYPSFVITQVIPPGGVCPFTDAAYSPNHHGIVFFRCVEPRQQLIMMRKTIAKKNITTSVHFRGPMDKFVQRV